MASKREEHRVIIKGLLKIGHSPASIQRNLKSMFGVEAPSHTTVQRWVNKFRADEEDVINKPRSGGPRVGRSDKNINKVSRLLEKDCEGDGCKN
jgi:transposase